MQQVQVQLTIPADVNRDFVVDIVDLAQFCANWLATGCAEPDDCGRADLIDDGTVNGLDFAEFAKYWLWP